jgi:hypothetical protein
MSKEDDWDWDSHYRAGRSSSAGPRAKNGPWKRAMILKYVHSFGDVIDLGCGDLSFWKGLECDKYIGIDISLFIVEKNRQLFPGRQFICSPGERLIKGLSAEVVLCSDVLYHVLEDKAFEQILRNLTEYSRKWIFVYTLCENIFNSVEYRFSQAFRSIKRKSLSRALRALFLGTDNNGYNMKYRRLENYYDIFSQKGFQLLNVHRTELDKHCALYVFRKRL